jgi:endonuclease YncB( thermonuclease family)
MICKMCGINNLISTTVCKYCGLGFNQSSRLTSLGFGKYKGKTVDEVFRLAPGYLKWLIASEYGTPAQKAKARMLLQGTNTAAPSRPTTYSTQSSFRDFDLAAYLEIPYETPISDYKPAENLNYVPVTKSAAKTPTTNTSTPQPQYNVPPKTSYVNNTPAIQTTTTNKTPTFAERLKKWLFCLFLLGLVILAVVLVIMLGNLLPTRISSSTTTQNNQQSIPVSLIQPTPTPTVVVFEMNFRTVIPVLPTPTTIPTVQSLPTAPPIPQPAQTQPQPQLNLTEARVNRIIDGDTIEIIEPASGTRRSLRFIGMNTPETKHPSRPVECFGIEAEEATHYFIDQAGWKVYLEKDVSETDGYGRLLRYVYIELEDELVMLNYILVVEGFATVATYPPDVKYQNDFLEAQKEARWNGSGLWGSC